jgi:hypothetical protein
MVLQIIKDIKHLKISYSSDKEGYLPAIAKHNSEKIKKKMDSKGLFNGPLACCTDFNINQGIIEATCANFGLFELSLNNFKNNKFPKLLNVNALLEVEDGFVMIKREKKVYSYPQYWDFPAGLVPFKDKPLERMKDRIVTDTELNLEDFEIEPEPFIITYDRKSFALYYRARCKKNQQELLEFFNKNFKKGTIKIIKKTEINNFLKDHKKVYPREVMHLI